MNLINIYSTPIWETTFPDFSTKKEDFISAILDYKNKNEITERKSNINGYQSKHDLHSQEDLRGLFQYICEVSLNCAEDLNISNCNVYITESWANINDSRNCYHSQHIHGDILSGVFYVKCPENSGKLCISNPGLNLMWGGCYLSKEKNQFTAESVKIEPEEGKILIWPSYLPHSVETNDHDDERISISFNIILVPSNADIIQ